MFASSPSRRWDGALVLRTRPRDSRHLGNRLSGPQRVGYRVANESEHRAFVKETNFCFCWMNIHIDFGRGRLDEKNGSRISPRGHHRPIRLAQGASYQLIANESAVDEEVLRVTRRPLLLRVGHEAENLQPV